MNGSTAIKQSKHSPIYCKSLFENDIKEENKK